MSRLYTHTGTQLASTTQKHLHPKSSAKQAAMTSNTSSISIAKTLLDTVFYLYSIASQRILDTAHVAGKLYNTNSSRLHSFIDNTAAEHWFLHPAEQFVTVCVGSMIFSFAMALRMGLLDDIRDAWAWMTRQEGDVVLLGHGEGEQRQVERHDGDDHGDDDIFCVRANNCSTSTSTGSDKSGLTISTRLFDHNKPAMYFAPHSAMDHRSCRQSTPGDETSFDNASANGKVFTSNSSLTMDKSLLQKEGLFMKDATLARVQGKDEMGRAERLALDDVERATLRATYLAKMGESKGVL
jgi:hypothetical protein